MDEGTRNTEFDVAELISKVRASSNGPDERARRVYNYLKTTSFSDWDVLCFATEYIASHAGVLEFLKPPAMDLIRLIYIAHFIRFEETAKWLDNITLDGQQLLKKEKSGEPMPGP